MTKTIKINIEELDCAEECSILRKTLTPYPGIGKLDFDVLNRQMQVSYDPALIDEKQLLSLIGSTGMHASIGMIREKRSPLRLLLCVLSGLFLLLALLVTGSFKGIFTFGLSEGPLPPQAIVLYLFSMVAGGWLVAPRALASLKHLSPDMNLLMCIAVIGAVILGQWFEGATVVFLFSVALLLEQWSVERARKAIQSLLNLTPTKAHVFGRGGELVEKEVALVLAGERILVRPGERIPLDGRVVKGSSLVNQAPITGESIPVYKEPGAEVFAGTLNQDGSLECEVTKVSSHTLLAQIVQMVEEAKGRKAKSEQWVEKFARVYTPVMLCLALLMALLPPLFGVAWSESVYRALVLLVIACPCALVISTPVSVVSALTAAAREGVLIKGGIHLERAGRLKAIAFDKTGTITEGRPEVQRIIPLNGHTERELLEIASALEQASDHPLARAVVEKADSMGLRPKPAHSFQIFRGMGAEGTIDQQRFWIGSHRFMHEKTQETPEIHAMALELEDAGHSIIAIGDFSHVCGLISVADSPRPLARETLAALKELGILKQVMLTGDHAATARLLAEKVGIEEFYSDLLPDEKVTAIGKLTQQYGDVAMIGDGINDAPALAASSLGIAMGGKGSAAAFETADVVLMADDLGQLPMLIRHARRSLKIIKQNIGFALGLKMLFFVLAAVGLSSLWMAIAADTGASLLVIANALRLLSFGQSTKNP